MAKKVNNFDKIILLFTVFILNYPFPVNAQIICDSNYVCALTEERDNNKIDLFIKNILTYEITVTIEFSKLKNIITNVNLPYTTTIPGEHTVKVMTLQPKDIEQAWEYNFKFFSTEGNLWANHDNTYVYTLPYASGSSFIVTQGFNGTFSHNGEEKYAIDWGMPEGTEINAARDGIVVGIKDDSSIGGIEKKFSAFANYIIIKHKDGTFGAYLHLKKNGVKVSLGQRVIAGEIIGFSGNTGWSGAPHLHFWVYKAKNGKQRESFPIRFRTSKEDSTILLEGKYYTAP